MKQTDSIFSKSPVSNKRYSQSERQKHQQKDLNYESLRQQLQIVGLDNQYVDDSNLDQLTKGQQMKSLLLLKAQQQQKNNRPKTFNFRIQNKILQPFQFISEEDFQILMNKSEKINNIDINDLFKIYKTKCQGLFQIIKDNNIDFLPEQAVKFLERFKINSINNNVQLNEENLGYHSSTILSKIISQNNSIFHLQLQKNQFDQKSLIKIVNYLKQLKQFIKAKALSVNKSIISIDLSSNSLRPQDIQTFLEIIQNNKTLVKLDFKSMMGQFRNKIADTFEFKRYLQLNESLQFLCVSRTNLNLKGLQYILQGISYNNSLVQLDVSCNHLGPQTSHFILKYMKKSTLQDLNLSENDLTNQGINNLVHLYIENPYFLKILNLSSNHINTDGLKQLFSQLNTNESLEKLILNNNPFSEKEIFDCLALFLKKNRKLKQLHLQHCRLNINNIELIVESLSVNQSLTHLNLSENALQNYGVSYISDGIKTNKCLKYLFIARCKIGDEGGQKIAQAWLLNKTLKSIDFHSNSLQDEAGLQIIKAILNNQNIQKINLNRNLISYKLQQEIYKFLKQNIYLKDQKRPQIIKEKVSNLKEFEMQKYDQFDIKNQLYLQQKQKQDTINQIQNKYKQENDEQNNIYNELEEYSIQLKFQEQKSVNQVKDIDVDIEDEINLVQKQLQDIEKEECKIQSQARHLKDEKERLIKIKFENQLYQKNVIEQEQQQLQEILKKSNYLLAEQQSYKNQIERLKNKIDEKLTKQFHLKTNKRKSKI